MDLSVADGELLAVVGPSGCGKTTTLRLIAGLETPDTGTIRIGDRSVNTVAPKDRDVAMVFQHYALYPHMTVCKNMAFGLKMRGYRRDDIDRRVRSVAETLGIAGLLDRKPAALSAGQRQRVALGRAIVREPQVFLFDEPLANLDVHLRVATRTHLRTLHRQLGTTIIHVTHDQEEAMTLGDRIAVMNEGRLLQVGTPLDVYRHPVDRFVAGFVGTPPMNFFEGTVRDVTGDQLTVESPFGVWPLPPTAGDGNTPPSGTPVIIGLRPEHVAIKCEGGTAPPDKTAAQSQPIEMRVTMIEPLGDRTHVHLSLAGGTELIATASSDVDLRPQQSVTVSIRRDRCHVFPNV